MKYKAAFIAILGACGSSAHAAALSAGSTATAIEANANASGQLVFVPLGALLDVSAGLMSVAEEAPGIYNVSAPLLTAGVDADGLLSLGVGVTAADVSVFSNVDGTNGPRATDGVSLLTNASVSLNLGVLSLVNLSLDSGTSVLESTSSILWDGVTLVPDASSNLISSGTTVTLSILGISVTIPTLLPGIEAKVSLDVNVPSVGRVQGDVFLTADKITEEVVGNAAYATATSLSAYIDISISALGTSVDFTTTVDINKTTAKTLAKNDASPVPETGMTLIMLSGSLVGLALLRRRMA